MTSFDTLLEDVEKLFEGVDFSDRISHLTDRLGTSLSLRFKEHGQERKPVLRMSNLGRPLRQLYYELKGVPSEPLSVSTRFKFMYGDILEEVFLFLAREAGHEVTDEQKYIEVDGVPGHIDGKIDGVLIDAKSCSPHSFKKFKSGEILTDDPFGYIAQLTGYAKAEKAERAAFIAIDKVGGHICVYEIPREQLDSYDVPGRIRTVREAVAGDSEPERCYQPVPVSSKDKTGNLCLPIPCSYCGWKEHCWRDSNDGKGLQMRQYSTGPRFFTKIVKEPKLKYDNSREEFPSKGE